MPDEAQKPDAPLLALETSGARLSAALWGPAGLLDEAPLDPGARHGSALAPTAEALLKKAGLRVRDLGAVAVSLGPGSWTGLRIGLAAAKAMAWGAGLDLVGVPSLEALALTALKAQPATGTRAVLALRNAYAEGLYAALFRETPDGLERLLKECVIAPQALPTQIRNGLHAAVKSEYGTALIVCGDPEGLAATAGWLPELNGKALAECREIPAAVLAERAWALRAAGKALKTSAEIHAAAPMYLRRSDPELKLQRKTESHPPGE